jgi:predicted methyltransferase
MNLGRSPFDPVMSRVPLVLTRLQRDTGKGVLTTLAFSTLCITLSIPHELRHRLLRTLLDAGYVTEEEGGQIRITEAGAQLVSPAGLREGKSR